MKMLFQNLIKTDSTITALSENASYPAANMQSQFLRAKYKATNYSDTITVLFNSNKSVNCFFYGYSNASAMQLKFYDNTTTLLKTVDLDCTYDSGSVFFNTLPNVRSIVITASCVVTQDLYIGGIASGLSVTLPNPVSTFDKLLVDKSSTDSSTNGQVSHNYIKPLEQYATSFKFVEREEYYSNIVSKYLISGKGHLWVDITEDNHEMYRPLYCTSNVIESLSRDARYISLTLTLTEAR